MDDRKRRAQRMRRRGDDEMGILGAGMRGLAAFRQMHAMGADSAGQSGVIRDQQNQAAFACDGAQGERALGTRFGVTGADNHQARPRQGTGGSTGVRQASIVGQKNEHTCVEGTRRSC